MFGRRRGRHRSDRANETTGSWADDLADEADGDLVDLADDIDDDITDTADHGGGAVPADRPQGPWDIGEPAPGVDRVDLGALRVPVGPDLEVQAIFVDDHIIAATVVDGPSSLQVQALAAPKTAGIWEEVRRDIVRDLESTSGSVTEVEGQFGIELRGQVSTETHGGPTTLDSARFVGVDGPRWLLRGLFIGPAADDPAAARRLEEVFRATVVVRGDAPVPPHGLLELRLPPEMQENGDGQGESEPLGDANGRA